MAAGLRCAFWYSHYEEREGQQNSDAERDLLSSVRWDQEHQDSHQWEHETRHQHVQNVVRRLEQKKKSVFAEYIKEKKMCENANAWGF